MAKQNAPRNELGVASVELQAAQIDEILKALAHPLRREILAWLRTPRVCFPDQQHGREVGVCAGQIHARAGLSASTVSAHLASLTRARLVHTQKFGQWIFYSRNEAVITALLRQLPQVV